MKHLSLLILLAGLTFADSNTRSGRTWSSHINHQPDYVRRDGTLELNADWDVGAWTLTALKFISDVTTGTQPYACTSTTLNINLNADLVDGINANTTATASQLLALDADKDFDLGTGDISGTDAVFDTLTTTELTVDSGGDTYWTGSGSGLAYGEISLYGNSTADTVSSGSYFQLTRFDTNGASNLTTPDHTNDHITISKTGVYFVTVSCSFSGAGSVTWDGGVFKNNGVTQLTNLQTSRKLGAGGDVGSVSISGIASFTANDTIEVWFQQNEGVDKDITVKDCTLSLVQIGG